MIRRKTNQRVIIYNAIKELGHPDMAQIIKHIQENYQGVSLATIYRNVTVLCDSKLITPITVNGRILYEVVKERHYHFVCKKCGKVCDIDGNHEAITVRADRFIDGNQIETADLTLYGICKECLEKN